MNKEDIKLLLASFVIAVVLWFQVQPMFEPGREREFIIPLRVEGKSEELAIFPSTDNITIVASGALIDLDKLDTTKVEAFLNAENAKPGQFNLPVLLRAPADLNLEFRPRTTTIRVTCERVLRQNGRIEVLTTGTPRNDLVLGETIATPSEVEVFGPESYIKQVSKLRVTVDLTRLQPGQSISIPVEILDKNNKPVPSTLSDPTRVSVAASFSAAAASREVPVIVDWIGSPASGYKIEEITVKPPRIKITGESEQISTMTTIETQELTVSDLNSSKIYKLKLIAPSGITLDTQQVEVTVKISPR